MKLFHAVFVASIVTLPAVAQEGDVAAGEKSFNKCQACHVVQNEAGEVLAGKAGKTGPNLFGVMGRQAGSVEGFRYRQSIVDAGAAGLVWTPELVADYLQDPSGFLQEFTGDAGARSGMTFKVRDEDEAENVAAFLATFGS